MPDHPPAPHEIRSLAARLDRLEELAALLERAIMPPRPPVRPLLRAVQ